MEHVSIINSETFQIALLIFFFCESTANHSWANDPLKNQKHMEFKHFDRQMLVKVSLISSKTNCVLKTDLNINFSVI